MEYCGGGSLLEIVEIYDQFRLTERQVAFIAREVPHPHTHSLSSVGHPRRTPSLTPNLPSLPVRESAALCPLDGASAQRHQEQQHFVVGQGPCQNQYDSDSSLLLLLSLGTLACVADPRSRPHSRFRVCGAADRRETAKEHNFGHGLLDGASCPPFPFIAAVTLLARSG